MKNKILLIILLFGFKYSQVSAQDTTAHLPQFALATTPSFFMFNSFNPVNNELKRINYPQLYNYATKSSIELLILNIKDTASITYEFSTIRPFRQSTINNIDVSMIVYQGMFNININLNYKNALKKKFFFEPYFGFGISTATLKVANESVATQPFDSSLSKLSGEKNFTSNIAFLLNVGITLQESISKRNNWYLGLRAGYEFDVNRVKWQVNNNNIPGEPRTDLGGFYSGVSLSYYFTKSAHPHLPVSSRK